MKTITEPGRQVEAISEVDVAVVGGGCAGLGAAIAAARNGAKTALIEQLGFLGGCITATHMDAFWMFRAGRHRAIEGLVIEMLGRVKQMGGLIGEPGGRCYVDVETFKLFCDRIIAETGIELWLHSQGVFPAMEGNAVRGVITESKSGRKAILAKAVVDGSGDGDIAYRAGAPSALGRESDGLTEPLGIGFRLSGVDVRKIRQYAAAHPDDKYFNSYVTKAKAAGDFPINRKRIMYHGWNEDTGEITGVNVVRIQHKDPTSTRDLTAAELEGREQIFKVEAFLRKYVPGFEKAQIAAIPTQVAPREGRRIIGGYVLTQQDIMKGSRFDDVVAVSPAFIDYHHPEGDGTTLVYPGLGKQGAESETMETLFSDTVFADAATYDIPYRCLLPNGVENVLTAGRCMSAEAVAVGSLRYLPISFATGQAAGTAAALAAKQGKSPRELDVEELQKTLVEQGMYLGE